jgi:hypothetical protein
MSKVVAIAGSLKAVLLVAAGALARGDMLFVILISAIFDLGLQFRHKVAHREVICAARDYQVSRKEAVDDSGKHRECLDMQEQHEARLSGLPKRTNGSNVADT